jgi:hypothetical protein
MKLFQVKLFQMKLLQMKLLQMKLLQMKLLQVELLQGAAGNAVWAHNRLRMLPIVKSFSANILCMYNISRPVQIASPWQVRSI